MHESWQSSCIISGKVKKVCRPWHLLDKYFEEADICRRNVCVTDGETFPVIAARKLLIQESQHERDPCVQAVVDAELKAVCPELIVCLEATAA